MKSACRAASTFFVSDRLAPSIEKIIPRAENEPSELSGLSTNRGLQLQKALANIIFHFNKIVVLSLYMFELRGGGGGVHVPVRSQLHAHAPRALEN